MIYDVHTHLFAENIAESRDNLLRAAELYGIDKLFVSGINSLPNPNEDMVRDINLEVERFQKEHPDLVRGYVYISPEHPNVLEVLRHGIEDQGFCGVKIWMSTLCDDMRVNPMVEKAIEYGVPILIHAFYKAVDQLPNETLGEHVARLAQRYPEAKLLMAHLGGSCYHGLPSIADCPNVWVDYSCSIFGGDDLQYAIEMLGADRILHGSDMPGSYLVNLGQLMELDIPQEDKDKIMFRNADKLFDRDFRPGRGGVANG